MTNTSTPEPHRANAKNPATAHCAFWLSPEQLEERHAKHIAAGRKLDGEMDCPCGNHTRRMYV
jgi:hypothetical protein